MTTVEVDESTWRRLNGLKDPGTSMDDVIAALLDEYEDDVAAHEPPITDGGKNDTQRHSD